MWLVQIDCLVYYPLCIYIQSYCVYKIVYILAYTSTSVYFTYVTPLSLTTTLPLHHCNAAYLGTVKARLEAVASGPTTSTTTALTSGTAGITTTSGGGGKKGTVITKYIYTGNSMPGLSYIYTLHYAYTPIYIVAL